jgi:hypothetical protein
LLLGFPVLPPPLPIAGGTDSTRRFLFGEGESRVEEEGAGEAEGGAGGKADDA